MPTVYVIGTCDTKGEELAFAADCVRSAGAKAVLVDVSTTPFAFMADVSAETVAAHHPKGAGAVLGQKDRGVAVSAMGLALKNWLLNQKNIGAVLGSGRQWQHGNCDRSHARIARGRSKTYAVHAGLWKCCRFCWPN